MPRLSIKPFAAPQKHLKVGTISALLAVVLTLNPLEASMKFIKYLMTLLVFAFSVFALSACDVGDKKAETFGEKVDEAVDNTRDSIDDAADEAGDKIEDTCEKATDKNC